MENRWKVGIYDIPQNVIFFTMNCIFSSLNLFSSAIYPLLGGHMGILLMNLVYNISCSLGVSWGHFKNILGYHEYIIIEVLQVHFERGVLGGTVHILKGSMKVPYTMKLSSTIWKNMSNPNDSEIQENVTLDK